MVRGIDRRGDLVGCTTIEPGQELVERRLGMIARVLDAIKEIVSEVDESGLGDGDRGRGGGCCCCSAAAGGGGGRGGGRNGGSDGFGQRQGAMLRHVHVDRRYQVAQESRMDRDGEVGVGGRARDEWLVVVLARSQRHVSLPDGREVEATQARKVVRAREQRQEHEIDLEGACWQTKVSLQLLGEGSHVEARVLVACRLLEQVDWVRIGL